MLRMLFGEYDVSFPIFELVGTSGSTGCKQRSYADPYKSLRIRKLTAFYMILNLRLILVRIIKYAV